MRGIGVSKHKFAQYAEVFLFLPDKNMKDQQIYTLFKNKLYLVKSFLANILMENNILLSESFILNIKIGHAVIESCKIIIPIKVRQKS